MKLLRILCPGHDPVASTALRDGVVAFNRGLDIRLRFLAIGIEDREITVTDGLSAAAQVESELDVVSTDRFTVVPPNIGAQMNGPDPIVWRVLPTPGEPAL